MVSHQSLDEGTSEQGFRSRIHRYLVWSALSCLVPTIVVLGGFLSGLLIASPDDIVMVVGGIMFGIPYVILPPALCFFGFGIYFDRLSHRVRTAQASKYASMFLASAVALLLGCLAGIVRGALPTTFSGFVEGALALGLIPSIVAVVRISRIEVR